MCKFNEICWLLYLVNSNWSYKRQFLYTFTLKYIYEICSLQHLEYIFRGLYKTFHYMTAKPYMLFQLCNVCFSIKSMDDAVMQYTVEFETISNTPVLYKIIFILLKISYPQKTKIKCNWRPLPCLLLFGVLNGFD